MTAMHAPAYHDRHSIYHYYLEHPSVSTDSRKIKEGNLFFALSGPNFDGNEYALDALTKGAAYAVVSRPDIARQDCRCLLVRDTLRILQEVAYTHRQQLRIPIVAITGTNGKTTTKELCMNVLRQKYKVVATEGNLNNHIGVPLTLLRITNEDEVAIIEMGANAPGEIKLLASIAQPTIGLVTNVGYAHLEGFGSIEGVLDTKSELPEHLKCSGGVFLLNTDDTLLRERWYHPGATTYGLQTMGGHKHIATGRIIRDQPFLQMDVLSEKGKHTINTRLIGAYNAENVLAAIAVGRQLNVSLDEIINAIEGYVPSNHRSQIVRLDNEVSIILDCYNANPSSMTAAIENLLSAPEQHKFAILGDMKELGSDSLAQHKQIISKLVKTEGISALFSGPEYKAAFDEIPVESLPENFHCFETTDDLISFIEERITEFSAETVILVKGSRSMELERLQPILEEIIIDDKKPLEPLQSKLRP